MIKPFDPHQYVGQEGAEIEVGKGARRGIWETQESVHNRTYPSDPRH